LLVTGSVPHGAGSEKPAKWTRLPLVRRSEAPASSAPAFVPRMSFHSTLGRAILRIVLRFAGRNL
jgi:hypothetical protein